MLRFSYFFPSDPSCGPPCRRSAHCPDVLLPAAAAALLVQGDHGDQDQVRHQTLQDHRHGQLHATEGAAADAIDNHTFVYLWIKMAAISIYLQHPSHTSCMQSQPLKAIPNLTHKQLSGNMRVRRWYTILMLVPNM